MAVLFSKNVGLIQRKCAGTVNCCMCEVLHCGLQRILEFNATYVGQIYIVSELLNRMSQEECARLRESVPYVELYRYNPKHLYPKLNGYGDNGQRNLKLWQLLHTYWLPNTYWNWRKYVVSVMLISVLNIKVIVSDIKPLNWTTKTLALLSYLSLGLQVLYAGCSWSVILPWSLHYDVS